MRWTRQPYEDFVRRRYDDLREIRRFGNCIVLCATRNGAPLLLLEEPWRQVTLCEYESAREREEDIVYLRSLGEGPASAGVLAPLHPVPPSRQAGEARRCE